MCDSGEKLWTNGQADKWTFTSLVQKPLYLTVYFTFGNLKRSTNILIVKVTACDNNKICSY